LIQQLLRCIWGCVYAATPKLAAPEHSDIDSEEEEEEKTDDEDFL
jgi:hypothetical protein